MCPLGETGFLEGRDFFPNFVAAVGNWTENRIEKKWEKKGVAKESGRDTYVEADGPVGRILAVKGVGGRKRINLIASLRNLSRVGHF